MARAPAVDAARSAAFRRSGRSEDGPIRVTEKTLNSSTMRNILACAGMSLWLVGCGGGGEGGDTAAMGSAPTVSIQGETLCGVDAGTRRLEGSVTNVHDGDTITVASGGTEYRIRLDGIDAPELAQPFGGFSRVTLSNAVLRKPVRVAYTKTDQYDRIVGSVFTDNCQYVNLDQVATGAAWFYKAYQCEVSAAVRARLTQSQDAAVVAKAGLWAQGDPEAPWFYRNGTEPVTPVCASDAPSWSANSALTSVGATTPANSATVIPVMTGDTVSTKTCYTGSRGGTYTLTPSGNKNYGGC